MPIIDTILAVSTALSGLLGRLLTARRDRRDRIATYFETLSNCLREVATTLRAGQVPHGKCAELDHYAHALPNTIGDEIGQTEALELAGRLASAYEVERLLSELNGIADREDQLAKLDRASGMFAAMATSIRAAP